jgi:hypothetical protein
MHTANILQQDALQHWTDSIATEVSKIKDRHLLHVVIMPTATYPIVIIGSCLIKMKVTVVIHLELAHMKDFQIGQHNIYHIIVMIQHHTIVFSSHQGKVKLM